MEYLVNELGSMLQNEVMMSFKIQCCYSPGVTKDNRESSGQCLQRGSQTVNHKYIPQHYAFLLFRIAMV